MSNIDWGKEHILYIANEIPEGSDSPDEKQLRSEIEPWLTAVFQSEHLSLLLGTGITTGICYEADVTPQAMQRIEFTTEKDKIYKYAESEAKCLMRGKANFEDDLRTAIELLKGLKILENSKAANLEKEINEKLKSLIINLLANEKSILESEKRTDALALLKRFLISFSSRTATRDRLHIFTTNYDRFIEYSLDAAGIYTLDRFIGKLNPILRMHKMELDFHYNPPGIRGEPRYVEGVVRYTKLHGSLDWRFSNGEIQKEPMPFGISVKEDDLSNPYETNVIYPNSAKGLDTAYFPYSELFRDFSTATCRPNSVLVTYGYGFGDSHINAIILDMMTIPSTHLVIIAFDKADGRIESFVNKCNLSQLTLLIGNHFGHVRILTENYLPKSAIDRISDRRHKIEEKRGSVSFPPLKPEGEDE
jgi:hypothetical protein